MTVGTVLQEDENVFVSLDVVWHGSAGKFDARVGQISMEGCFIDSMGQEVLGESIHLNVRMPSGIWVALIGKVSYQEYPIGFEVKFSDLTAQDEILLMQVVAAKGGANAQRLLNEIDMRATDLKGLRPTPRILIADDDPMTVEMLRASIQVQGYEVVCAADGREAFHLLQDDTDFVAMIFDMTMPHLNGLGLAQYVRRDERMRNIPIGMVTAEQDPKVWNDSIAAGVNIFLPKPFTAPQIHMMLKMLDKNAEVPQVS
jgi:CheY-like chemotaxis protein